MREIKFRAWDKWDKKMDWVDGSFLDNPSQIAGNWKEFLILMQYTGLKDKNGVEIYEGDIIRLGDDPLFDGEVSWNEEWAAWENNGITLQEAVETGCAVIGNVFQNPELLNDPHQDN